MTQYILAIDQGTTGSTALILDFAKKAQVIGRANVEFNQHFPKQGWVEHDLEEIWQSVLKSITVAVDMATQHDRSFIAAKIAAIGITNQRETLCIFDRKSGKPLRKAIVWQCRRGTDICTSLKQQGFEPLIRAKTGLLLDPYFTGSKLRWVLEEEADLAAKIKRGEAFCSTIESYLLYKLTNGKSFATDASNASRTLLYDIDKGIYDSELLSLFGLADANSLPPVKDSIGEFGRTADLGVLPDGIPITAMVGDQQAALAGQCCFAAGEAKCTFGTGAFLLSYLGEHSLRSSAGLLTTVAWQHQGKRSYAFEGAAFIAGAAVQFLRDQLGFIHSAADAEAMASQATAAPEIYFVPALAGLGAPYWQPLARGSFFGLTRGTSREQLIRAALESIAFQVTDLIETMNADARTPVRLLKVDGGASANLLLMQMQADLAHVLVDRPQNLETTATGAAMFAALGCGLAQTFDDLSAFRVADIQLNVRNDKQNECTEMLKGWKRAVNATIAFSKS